MGNRNVSLQWAIGLRADCGEGRGKVRPCLLAQWTGATPRRGITKTPRVRATNGADSAVAAPAGTGTATTRALASRRSARSRALLAAIVACPPRHLALTRGSTAGDGACLPLQLALRERHAHVLTTLADSTSLPTVEPVACAGATEVSTAVRRSHSAVPAFGWDSVAEQRDLTTSVVILLTHHHEYQLRRFTTAR